MKKVQENAIDYFSKPGEVAEKAARFAIHDELPYNSLSRLRLEKDGERKTYHRPTPVIHLDLSRICSFGSLRTQAVRVDLSDARALGWRCGGGVLHLGLHVEISTVV